MQYPILQKYHVSCIFDIYCLLYIIDVINPCVGPTRLDLVVTLNAISNYLNETWKAKWQRHIIGNFGQVIIILAPSAQISETEQQLILNLLREIKNLHPGNQIFMLNTLISLTICIIYISVITDLYFIYYTSQRNSHLFQPFILSEQDRLILSPNIDAIIQHLSTGKYYKEGINL